MSLTRCMTHIMEFWTRGDNLLRMLLNESRIENGEKGILANGNEMNEFFSPRIPPPSHSHPMTSDHHQWSADLM